MKLIPASAAVLAAALTVAGAASAQVSTLPLPAPPVTTGAASSAIFDAMLAIARAVTTNPKAAQAASFSYDAAIQQFNAGEYTRSRMSALTAMSQTAVAPLPQPSLYPPPIPQPTFYTMPAVVSAVQADAEGYVALARRAMGTCGGPGAAPAPAALQQYDASSTALLKRDYAAARAAAQSAIDQCAAASLAYAAQQAALPQPPSTPIPMESYSPVPVATLIPDPALQPATR